jgi:transcriptional regulator with XRE-family HTH domain
MADTEHIGLVIKALREERGLSKKRLARESLISDAYLVQIEQGRRTPSEKVLRRLAAAMQLPPWKLLEPAGVYTPETVERAQEINKSIQALRDTAPTAISDEDLAANYGNTLEQLSSSPLADQRSRLYAEHPEVIEYESNFRPMPEGWTELSSKDQRLVQQLINRLRYVDTEDE